MPRFAVLVSHFFLNLSWNSLFRTSYSPKALRRNFDFLAGTTQASLQRKYPRLRFKNFELNGLPVEEIVATESPSRTVLYLHGGGYIMGSIHAYRLFAVKFAYRLKARIMHRTTWSPMYRGNLPETHPFISPLFCDPSGFCPLMLFAGDREVLLDDSLLFAEKAKAAGVDVTVHVGKGMQHDWPLALPYLRESKAAWKELENFVQRSTE